MEEKVSLKTIADICGVSVATVSRVINRNGRFSEETGERVRRVIEEYNYHPNQIAKGLRTNRLNSVGIVVPDITNEFFASIVRSVQHRLFIEGYSCLIFNTDESWEIERQCIANLKALNISSVVFVNSKCQTKELLNWDVPVFYVDREPDSPAKDGNFIFLSSDHEHGGYLAGQELALCGCKTVACITALEDASVTRLRSAGFFRACSEYGLDLPQNMVFTPQKVSFQAGYDIINRALLEGKRFEGLFCETDWLAIGALTALLEHGISVPEQVQLVGFDDITAARTARCPLTTVHQPSIKIGTQLAELILATLNGCTVPQRDIKLPVQLIRRESTCPRF